MANYNVKNSKNTAKPKRTKWSISKKKFENLYKIVLIEKRKLTKNGKNHPFPRLDKFLLKDRKARLSIWIKIGLVDITNIKQITVTTIDASRAPPLLKTLIRNPNETQSGR